MDIPEQVKDTGLGQEIDPEKEILSLANILSIFSDAGEPAKDIEEPSWIDTRSGTSYVVIIR